MTEQINFLKTKIEKCGANVDVSLSPNANVLLVTMKDYYNIVIAVAFNPKRNTIVCRSNLIRVSEFGSEQLSNIYEALLVSNSIISLSHFSLSGGYINLVGELDFDSREKCIKKELNTIAENHFESLDSLENLKQSKEGK
ncbi:DUF2170 family protein [Photobacterium kishitanii]|uniref:Uncharacterized protein n=1 Tax=Photobacterium kishitanii TaxID=318456 RepID=A0A2T3KM73_9GAMM|nr:DUF2170 family protein [Photobacterium kishitanii]PSV00900.1 hypothetical protein C9J27_02415 [Photobacterium kishitanii]